MTANKTSQIDRKTLKILVWFKFSNTVGYYCLLLSYHKGITYHKNHPYMPKTGNI